MKIQWLFHRPMGVSDLPYKRKPREGMFSRSPVLPVTIWMRKKKLDEENDLWLI